MPVPECGHAIAETIEDQSLRHFGLPMKPLLHFEDIAAEVHQEGILFSLGDYLLLVDTTGRMLRRDKRGAIPLHLSPILDRLGIDRKTWINNATNFEKIYHQRFGRKRQTLKKTG